MLKRLIRASTILAFVPIVSAVGGASVTHAATCAPTGFFRDGINMTAALINPAGTVSGPVAASGCNIGIYYGSGSRGKVNHADVSGANYFGVVNDGGDVSVANSSIHDIGESPLNGTQHGLALYWSYDSGATGSITGNQIWNYQKGGVVVNGPSDSATVSDNTVQGQGPVAYIAQNGIQIGYGASASVMRNYVAGNSYTGDSTVSGGIIVVGGPFYSAPYTTNTKIDGNTIVNNDVGVFLTNLAADGGPPATATNVKVVNNTISDSAVTNGFGYQAGISDVGNNDKIINNTISGAGYAQDPLSGTYAIDTDPSYSPRAKVHANAVS
jgi:hypothetical protein